MSGTHLPGDPGGSPDAGEAGEPGRPQWAALSRDGERTRRRLDALEALMRDFGDSLATTTHPVTPDPPAPGAGAPAAGGAGVQSWLLGVEPERAAVALAQLVVWLNRVYLAYPEVSLPSCWLWHPHVVEELWWLYQAHTDAYHPVTGNWLRIGDWHDRQRPNTGARVKRALGNCDPTQHRSEYGPFRDNSVNPSTESINTVASWLADGTPSPPPLPPLDPPIVPPPIPGLR